MTNISTRLQQYLPQQALTRLGGFLANNRNVWLKNYLISYFMKKYKLELSEAIEQNPLNYPTFNSFFIRQLRPELRPICTGPTIASPADGVIAQIGTINQNQLLQAKQMYFDLETLLGGDHALASTFNNGSYATLYLAPHNYHRVHMPLTGTLLKTIYVPGKLFSVNRMTSDLVPQLYSRNERLICLFQTEAGLMTIVLVGAMVVGNIQTVWSSKPLRNSTPATQSYADGPVLSKGAEMGHFELGSTVILLFEPGKMVWDAALQADVSIQFGQSLGKIII